MHSGHGGRRRQAGPREVLREWDIVLSEGWALVHAHTSACPSIDIPGSRWSHVGPNDYPRYGGLVSLPFCQLHVSHIRRCESRRLRFGLIQTRASNRCNNHMDLQCHTMYCTRMPGLRSLRVPEVRARQVASIFTPTSVG